MTPTLCMVDLSHNDAIPTKTYKADLEVFQAMLAGRYPFLMHKLTQGIDFVDPTVMGRLPYAVQAGFAIGVYHFMDTSPIAAQMAYFMMGYHILMTKLPANTKVVMALDFEYTQGTPDETSTGYAGQFVQGIKVATGKWPLLYTGRWDIEPQTMGTPLAACGLWLAAYNNNPAIPQGWVNYTWWQKYGDGLNGSPSVPGIGPDIDQSLFAGSRAEAEAWWVANSI